MDSFHSRGGLSLKFSIPMEVCTIKHIHKQSGKKKNADGTVTQESQEKDQLWYIEKDLRMMAITEWGKKKKKDMKFSADKCTEEK